jgi:hypothetical protein
MHHHSYMLTTLHNHGYTPSTTEEAAKDPPRQTRADVAVEHDHGVIADAETHDHAVTLAIEVDGRLVTLRKAREGD